MTISNGYIDQGGNVLGGSTSSQGETTIGNDGFQDIGGHN